MKVKPHQHYVLIRKILPETRAGLHLPDTVQASRDHWTRYIVQEVGEDVRDNVKPGMDVVLMPGQILFLDDQQTLLLVSDKQVIGEQIRDEKDLEDALAS